MPTRPPAPHLDPSHPQAQPAMAAPPAGQPSSSTLNVTGPMLKDHAEIRAYLGELRSSLDQFSLPGIRRAVMELHDVLARHSLAEEAGLFLIGMKVLRPDNEKLPTLIGEHHSSAGQLASLIRALYSPRLTNVQEELRNLGFVFIDDLEHHLEDEEQVVFPALERLLPDELKKLILERYKHVNKDELDELERTPLISLPPLEGQNSPLPVAGQAAGVFPNQGLSGIR